MALLLLWLVLEALLELTLDGDVLEALLELMLDDVLKLLVLLGLLDWLEPNGLLELTLDDEDELVDVLIEDGEVLDGLEVEELSLDGEVLDGLLELTELELLLWLLLWLLELLELRSSIAKICNLFQ